MTTTDPLHWRVVSAPSVTQPARTAVGWQAQGRGPADLVGAELYGIAGDVAEAVENRREDWLEIRDMHPHPADDPAQRRVVMLAEADGGREVEITVRLTGRLYAVPGEAS